MSDRWAEKTAQELLNRGLPAQGLCLVLGAADTGKTTLITALAQELAQDRGIAIVDADIGQSHIGPPTTVGWALVDKPQPDLSKLAVGGISFVGHITPVGHLLQITTAIIQCTREASNAAELVIIDTPGFVFDHAAAALWWTVQRILEPQLLLTVQHNNELSAILTGLRSFAIQIESIKSPDLIPSKTPEQRRTYRRRCFSEYFQSSIVSDILLDDLSVQAVRPLICDNLINRVVALRDAAGLDLAIGMITGYDARRNIVTVRTPQLDIRQVQCLAVGDIEIDVPDE